MRYESLLYNIYIYRYWNRKKKKKFGKHSDSHSPIL